MPDAKPPPPGTAARPDAATPRAAPNRALQVVVALLLVGGVVAFFALGGPQYLDLATIKEHRDALLGFTQAHFAAALAIAFAVYAGAVAFSLPGGLVLSLTMGFVFG